jgi:Na+-translocating ferredoxin:NAD+ oxidoreductase subunit G
MNRSSPSLPAAADDSVPGPECRTVAGAGGAERPWPVRFLEQSWLVLLLAMLLAGALAGIEHGLQPRIQQEAERRLLVAALDVVPGGTSSRPVEVAETSLFLVEDDQQNPLGWAIPATASGFVDKIELLVGLSLDGQRMLGLAVLQSKENPGLGERIREEAFRDQFRGLPAAAELVVVKPGQTAPHAVDAITGATISTWAVVRGVQEQLERIRPQLPDVPSDSGRSDGA